nr:hypothetical protein [Tanacetum cinerariifolium]
LYVMHPVDKPKPLGDNENPKTKETFDPLFCDLKPISSEPSEVPNVGEPSEVPNVGEPNEFPNVAEPNKVSNFTNENVESVGPNEVSVEDTQLVEAEVFKDLDLEDFDSAIDPDDIDCNRKKALKMLARKHKPFGPNGLSVSSGLNGKSKLEKTKMTDSQSSGKPKVVAKVFRAKQMAQDNIIRDYVNQYARLKDCALELQEHNLDTTIKIDVERTCEGTSDTGKCKRIDVCLGDLKSEFKARKRDLLGLDGCFMSGPYPGQILTVVGVDTNIGTYTLAYAVVEAETKDIGLGFLIV